MGKVWRVVWVTLLALVGFSLVQVLFCKWVNPPLTPLMVSRYFAQLRDPDRTVHFERKTVRIDDISPNLINAVAIAEDGGLYMYHHGFAIKQMKERYVKMRTQGGTAGASTISQQTAKNCFLPHSHSLFRKAVEAYYTVLIEAIWGKRRIMECYLNIIEFGDGIYGCEAASQHYFHHSASQLTRYEAALLAASLPTPLRSNPARPSRYLQHRASEIAHRMGFYGKIDFDKKREELNPQYLRMVDEESLMGFLWWVVCYETGIDSTTPHKK